MDILKKLSKLFSKKEQNDTIEFAESMYCAVINEKMSWYHTKDDMLKAIESYSKVNSVFSLSMFRYDMYNLIK